MRLLLTAIAVLAASPLVAEQQPAQQQSTQLQALVKAHCLDCHSSATRESGLDLEKLPLSLGDPDTFDKWVRVHDRLAAREMPPASETQPAKGQRDAAIKELSAALTDADAKDRQDRGRSLFRRLNRTEYENTLRDLFDLPMLSVQGLLPEDGFVDGFNKVGQGLDVSSVQMAQYLEAADVALDMAIARTPEKPEFYSGRHFAASQYAIGLVLFNGDAVFLKDKKYDDSLLPIVRDLPDRELVAKLRGKAVREYEGSVGVFRHEDCAFLPNFASFSPIYPGRYRLRISLWSYHWNKGQVQPATKMHSASLMAGGRLLGYFDVPSLESKVHEIDVWLNAGEQVSFNAASLWPVRVSQSPGRAAGFVGPGIAIDWFEAEGPFIDQWPPTGHRRLFADLPFAPLPKKSSIIPPKRTLLKAGGGHSFPRPPKHSHDIWTVASPNDAFDAARLLSDFLPRAFRRPVAAEEVERYASLVKERLAAGHCFETAMRTAYKAALCSPDFLFLRELPGPLDDYALASRMSYFLWNSMPDDALLEAAKAGQLANGKKLNEHVKRMLDDPKSERFVNDFLDQWLSLREIDFTMPDRKLYPEFHLDLYHAMLGESRAFFRELLQKDESATAIVHSDFALLNQRMCEHYGLFADPSTIETLAPDEPPQPLVTGARFQRVLLPPDSHRGGFLTQASVLKVTANGTSTSPVKRGAWVLSKLLNQPPTPPPPDIPAVEPDVRGTTTIRDQLAKHRAGTVCASCHSRIDPPGFALESFDVIGGFRDRYRSTDEGEAPNFARVKMVLGARREPAYRMGLPVECSGETTNGQKFADIDEFKRFLLRDPDKIAENVARQLLTYATGAPVGFADRPALEKIVKNTKRKQHGLRTLVVECVNSPLFRSK